MIKNGPKIEERRVILKEISEYAVIDSVHSFHVFFWILILCKNNLNSEHLFL